MVLTKRAFLCVPKQNVVLNSLNEKLESMKEMWFLQAPEKVSESHSVEKAIPKDDSHVLSAERRPNSDAQTSPL